MNLETYRRGLLPGLKTLTVLGAATCFATAGLAAEPYASAAPKTHAVTIEGLKFSPQTIEVSAGDSVVWTNKDPFPHTVVANDESFRSKEIEPNTTFKFASNKSGTVPYACTLHPTMTGTVVVR